MFCTDQACCSYCLQCGGLAGTFHPHDHKPKKKKNLSMISLAFPPLFHSKVYLDLTTNSCCLVMEWRLGGHRLPLKALFMTSTTLTVTANVYMLMCKVATTYVNCDLLYEIETCGFPTFPHPPLYVFRIIKCGN